MLGPHLPTSSPLWWPQIHTAFGGVVLTLRLASSLGSLYLIAPLCWALFPKFTSWPKMAASALALTSAFQPAGRRKGEDTGLSTPFMTSRNCTHHFC